MLMFILHNNLMKNLRFDFGCFPFRRYKSTQVNTLKHSLPQLNGTRYTQELLVT